MNTPDTTPETETLSSAELHKKADELILKAARLRNEAARLVTEAEMFYEKAGR